MVIEQEGVIQYHLDFQPGPAPPASARLLAWRRLLHRLGLLGQDPARYEGYGFGNISERHAEGFIISGSQTGTHARLGPAGYCAVLQVDIPGNRVLARGPVRPSSESLTHAAVYQLDPGIGAVFHVHSPEIWQAATALGLPLTDPAVPYGTPAMAAEVARLGSTAGVSENGLFVMAGHLDGVVSYGPDLESAGQALVAALIATWAQGNVDNVAAAP